MGTQRPVWSHFCSDFRPQLTAQGTSLWIRPTTSSTTPTHSALSPLKNWGLRCETNKAPRGDRSPTGQLEKLLSGISGDLGRSAMNSESPGTSNEQT